MLPNKMFPENVFNIQIWLNNFPDIVIWSEGSFFFLCNFSLIWDTKLFKFFFFFFPFCLLMRFEIANSIFIISFKFLTSFSKSFVTFRYVVVVYRSIILKIFLFLFYLLSLRFSFNFFFRKIDIFNYWSASISLCKI